MEYDELELDTLGEEKQCSGECPKVCVNLQTDVR